MLYYFDRRMNLKSESIGIIDLGIGSVLSVRNMLLHISNLEIEIIDNPKDVFNHDKIILPGVGNFKKGAEVLKKKTFNAAIKEYATSGNKIMGICLGAQLLTDYSEEGDTYGLGLVSGHAAKFKFDKSEGFKIPHMGWNIVTKVSNSKITENLHEGSKFYFAHSFHFQDIPKLNQIFTTEYGYEFCSAFQSDNIVGVQFHPEKSHKYGMQILRNFTNW